MSAPPTPASRADAIVVGGGPAGSAAAITLARLGRRAVVVDKAAFPRDKCCGDGLTAAALRRVQHLGLDPADVPSWQPVSEVVVVAASGREVHLPLRDAEGGILAASARRTELDAALLDLARGAGAEIIEGHAVVASDGAGVDLDDGRRLTAPYVIAADGMWSPMRRLLGTETKNETYLGEWQAGRQYMTGTGPDARKLWVWFEPDMVPGYTWSFPLAGDAVNVGYGVLRQTNQNPALKGQKIEWSERPAVTRVLGPDARPDGPWRAWPIPARIGEAVLSAVGGRVLFVGDAAGACDPMTGEGIAQALETGELAARAIAQAGPGRPHLAATRYERQIAAGLSLDDRLSRLLSKVLARPTGSDRALAVVDASDWCRRHFVRWMFEDYPRAALATPHRWRRRMFTSPGAYRPAQPVGSGSPGSGTFAGHERNRL